MVFSSPLFLSLFLPVLLLIYTLFRRCRAAVLTAGSLLFYSWGEPVAVLVMLACIGVNYGLALLIGGAVRRREPGCARLLLTFGIGLDLAVLIFYKYLSFAVTNLNLGLSPLGFSLNDPAIPLPVGISFYLFQIISYLMDVYRGEVEPERKLLSFALYVSLFPQLIAGPIVRYRTIAAEIPDRSLRLPDCCAGLRRFVLGLAKKVLIADSMAVIADRVFAAEAASVPTLYCWLGAAAYMLQIYFDFSGYSDMAIGLGRVFNFHFPENFNFPYAARSVQDFWRRWHISLSSWFRDYLYIPLGGSRGAVWQTYRNLLIVFLLCGLWHGAAWPFVVWGLYQGAGLVIERLGFRKILDRLPGWIGHCYVLLFVLIGWVIFRSPTLEYAGVFLKNMFCGNPACPVYSFTGSLELVSLSNLLVLAGGFAFSCQPAAFGWCERWNESVKTALTALLFAVVYGFAMTSAYSPFIYFRF